MARIASMLVGAWLLVSGIAIESLARAPVPQWWVGVLVLVVEAVALLRFDALRWVGFAAGLWVMIQPFLFDLGSGALAFVCFSMGLALVALDSHPTHPALYTDPTTYNREIYHAQGGGKAYR